MVYENKLLKIRILFENFQKRPVYGIRHPQAYMEETGHYSSSLRFNILKKEIKKGPGFVFETILESPAGFGEYLREGALFIIKDGLDVIGKAILLEVLGYVNH